MSPIHQLSHPTPAVPMPGILGALPAERVGLHKGWQTFTHSLARGDHSPVVILEKLLIDSMGQGETGCHQPDNRDAESSLCQGHPLLQRVQDDLQPRLCHDSSPTGSKGPHKRSGQFVT